MSTPQRGTSAADCQMDAQAVGLRVAGLPEVMTRMYGTPHLVALYDTPWEAFLV